MRVNANQPIDFSSQLNPVQWEAVRYLNGPSLVIAGAGSGKTRMLTYKVAYLISQGFKPWNILALTFTNKAAREMRERIESLIGGGSTSDLWAGTFHSIFARILRREADAIEFSQNYTIYDADDQKTLLKHIVKARQLDDKAYKPGLLAARISDAKNRLILPDMYQADSDNYKRDKASNIPECGSIYAEYQRTLHQSDAMDFDDLLLNTYLLFRDHDDIRQRYKERFNYILVDEYQDTNYAQHRIITLLADDPHSNICVVGDDAQSIYSFRGANIDNILGFNKQYPEAKLFKLERNYRSTKTIVNAADCIIRHNQHQIPKTVFSEEADGEPLRVIAAASDKEEAAVVAKIIHRLHHKEHLSWESFAVLYRTNAQSRAFEEAFSEHAIPYRVYGSMSFYQRKEIKDTIAYLRLMVNPSDDVAFRRVINTPSRGIGQTSVNRLVTAAAAHGLSLWETAERANELETGLSGAANGRIKTFLAMISALREKLNTTSALPLITEVLIESGLQAELLRDMSLEGQTRRENIDSLFGSVGQFESDYKETHPESHIAPLTDYLASVALLTDADQKEDGSPRVTVMTIHAAKGLEFDTVFVTGLEAGLFPTSAADFSFREMEEERRLFYVAVTRAERLCFLTHAARRFRYGTMDFCDPSPFLNEIDAKYLSGDSKKPIQRNTPFSASEGNRFNFKPTTNKLWERPTPAAVPPRPTLKPIRHTNTPAASVGSIPTTNGTLKVGSRVRHERFGLGTVKELTTMDDTQKARITFDEAGDKNLLLRFARLEIL